ncbi:metallophosphoesterase [Formosa sp. Hel1_33_131]|uniref:metallophosphoesterase n=1 Tax=Formosa sp. Hel1_33_131 TaxID=1336794 RepID=UPI00084E120E|nr:metallophosphoesterase [Formosa sp. Hel1_33_131]AOR29655.1 metallophosphoesterase [Formosa sp. Hel1_33_131]
MKKTVFLGIFYFIIINKTVAQTTDGPYIFYQNKDNNSAKILQVRPEVVNDTTQYKIALSEIENIDKNDVLSFDVEVYNKKKETFNVLLQKEYVKEQSEYSEPPKLLALSDLEGNFYAYKKMLISAGVMSKDYQWVYGDGHLVIVGDMFDRGDNVTQCLWLTYELERQAKQFGGKVHLIIGNHENMNLRGNTKYVKSKYKNLAEQLKIPYKELFGTHTELGKWLRTKNAVVKIGNTIYVHAGLSIDLVNNQYSLNDINRIAKKYYGNPNRKKIEESALVFSTKRGPLWYRGYFKNMDVSNIDITDILTYYDANYIVVGHTIQKKINASYKKRIIAIDLKHPKNESDGKLSMLLKENNVFYTLDEDRNKIKLK